MSSSLSDPPDEISDWQLQRDTLPNNGESSRQGRRAAVKRQPERSPPHRAVKRRRENTPRPPVEERSTSNEVVDQNASAMVSLEGTISAEGSNRPEALEARSEDEATSRLFSEQTQPLGPDEEEEEEGEDEEDFLPEEETRERGDTDLDDPIPLEDGDLFTPVDDDDEEEESLAAQQAARASDYIPRPLATDDFRVPRADHMSRVLEPEDIYFDEAGSDTYHSGDSGQFDMDHRPILERTAIKKDIKDFLGKLPDMVQDLYGVVDRLGEGTFSSVYLANDIEHDYYDNQYWRQADPDTPRSELPPPRVALKKILATSSPARIQNELEILESLRGCRNVSQLITAFRHLDQVIIVLPYHISDDFRFFYKSMDAIHMQLYMKALFQALKDIHQRGIVHRDVKPANFLFDYESGTGVLCDFGLAERYLPPRKACCQHAPATLTSLHGTKQNFADTKVVEQAVYQARTRAKLGEGRVGFLHEDKRGSVKTNRAGTRGLRAPEVLLKCPDQTVGIDIWSAGIMLLSMLTHKFPVFNSNDDIEALMEIAAVFGRAQVEKCALLHNRTILCNLPTLDNSPGNIKNLILKINPHIYTPPILQPTPDQARDHIHAMDQAMDLCARLLRLDVTRRLTAAEALKHPFFTGMVDEEDLQPVEIIPVTKGACGLLHGIDEMGRHRAVFGRKIKDMHFGMGNPPSYEEYCPEHLHYQQRTGRHPVDHAFDVAGAGPSSYERDPEPTARATSPTSTETSTNTTPEKPAPALPLPRLSQNNVQFQAKREVLGKINMNRSAAQRSLSAVATASGVPVKQVLGLGLGRFTGKDMGRDQEDEAMREAARRKLI